VAVTAPPSPPGRPALRTDGGFLENMLSGVQLDQSFLYAKEAQLVSLLTTTISRFLMERVLPQIQHVNATH
jgi:hypothetical protein